jgi:hypothetical protein
MARDQGLVIEEKTGKLAGEPLIVDSALRPGSLCLGALTRLVVGLALLRANGQAAVHHLEEMGD